MARFRRTPRFRGPKLHSAKWDSEVDYKDKTVGIIGNGSTGIQLVPAVQKDVRHMTVFMRSPTWLLHNREPVYLKRIFARTEDREGEESTYVYA